MNRKLKAAAQVSMVLSTVLSLVLGLVRCGGTSSPTPGVSATPAPTSSTTPALTQTIHITGFAFSPKTATVAAGTTVTWVNDDNASHTSTSDTGVWSSQTLNQTATYSFKFTTAGTYTYRCSFHSGMTATITVQ